MKKILAAGAVLAILAPSMALAGKAHQASAGQFEVAASVHPGKTIHAQQAKKHKAVKGAAAEKAKKHGTKHRAAKKHAMH